MNYRKKYIKEYGPIPNGMELHHIVPTRMGGTDDLENLRLMTREEHSKAHLGLYEKFGDPKDLCASYMLSGKFKTSREANAAVGGKIGGKLTVAKKLGIHGGSKAQRKKWGAIGGSASQKTLKEKQVSAFYDPKLRKNICSKGGKSGILCLEYYIKIGYSELEAKQIISEIQSKNGKAGGKHNAGSRWINNGVKTYKYTAEDQKKMSIEKFLELNPDIKLGKIK